MKHAEKRQAGKYTPAFSWHKSIRAFLDEVIVERPLLNVCSGPIDDFGDMRVDAHVKPIPPGVIADWTSLPFATDSYGAVFADPPWNLSQMKSCADFCKEALRVAPVAYLMSPWLWVNRDTRRSAIWIREFPGVNIPILLVKYERGAKMPTDNLVNTHSIAIGQEELKQPIPDYMLDEILGGTRIANQGLSKALARQVKELRQELSITVSAHGEVKRGSKGESR